jgi:hypothetical protein
LTPISQFEDTLRFRGRAVEGRFRRHIFDISVPLYEKPQVPS